MYIKCGLNNLADDKYLSEQRIVTIGKIKVDISECLTDNDFTEDYYKIDGVCNSSSEMEHTTNMPEKYGKIIKTAIRINRNS